MTREKIILALVIFLAIGLFSLDTVFTPLWLTALQLTALAFVGYLIGVLMVRMRRQAEKAKEHEQVMAKLREANERLGNEIAEHRWESEALRASEERYRALAETAHDMFFIVGRDGVVQYVNSFGAEQFGRRPEEIVGRRRAELFPPEASARQEDSLQEVFRTGMPVYRETSTPFPGRELWLDTWLTPLRNAAGEAIAVMGISRDITERKQHEQQLAYLAGHDPLTALANRRSLEAALDRAVARARRGFVSSLLLLDVDNFKTVNDALGHAVGDQALISLASLLRKELRFEDLLARFGGDEFAVLLEGTNSEPARLVAARMCQAVRELDFAVEGRRFPLSLSVGLAAIDGHHDTSRVLTHADAAMYEAKEQGGDRTVLYRSAGTVSPET